MKTLKIAVQIFIALILTATTPRAEETNAPATPTAPAKVKKAKKTQAKKGEPKKKAPKPLTKGNREAEGTQAAERFENDPVIKSQYKHKGEALEVDPD